MSLPSAHLLCDPLSSRDSAPAFFYFIFFADTSKGARITKKHNFHRVSAFSCCICPWSSYCENTDPWSTVVVSQRNSHSLSPYLESYALESSSHSLNSMSYKDASRRARDRDRDHVYYESKPANIAIPSHARLTMKKAFIPNGDRVAHDNFTEKPDSLRRPNSSRFLPFDPASPRAHSACRMGGSLPKHNGHLKYMHSSPSRASPDHSQITGTDFSTGINPHDSAFPKLLYHSDHTPKPSPHREPNPMKNYKVLYDPELDKSLSLETRKSKSRKTRFNGEGLHKVADPRRANVALYFQKPNKLSKKFPFKLLPRSKFIHDGDSLGPPPHDELVVWDLPPTISEIFLSSFIAGFGEPIKDMKFHNDPINAVPLGIATFKFPGNPERAERLAKNLMKQIKSEHAKVDGKELKIGLNDHESAFLQLKIVVAQKRLEALRLKNIRLEEEKKRMRKQLDADAKQAEKDFEATKSRDNEQSRSMLAVLQRYSPGTTTLSIKHHSKVVSGTFLPTGLNKYIKNRPYLLIYSKYVSTRASMSSEIKRKLKKYDWTRVLSDSEGYFIVFNSLKECIRCFVKEDGQPLFEYRMHMELAVPEAFVPAENDMNSIDAEVDAVDEAANMLIKEFQSFLAKDIRERVIAPVILDLLSNDKYPELYHELKSAEQEMAKPKSTIVGLNKLKEEALQRLAKQREEQQAARANPQSKNKGATQGSYGKKQLIPMQHALNFDNSSEEDDEDEDSSRCMTPNLKRSRSPAAAPIERTISEEQDADGRDRKKQRRKIKADFMYNDLSDDEEGEGVVESQPVIEPLAEALDVKVEPEQDDRDAASDAKYLPTEGGPMTVYPVGSAGQPRSLPWLQSIIKDDEDLRVMSQVLQDLVEEPSSVPDIRYWAWKQYQADPTGELLGQVSPRLECSTGCFRTEGYRKIPDVDKTQFIPHRRQVNQPIKSVQCDDDEIETKMPVSQAATSIAASDVVHAANAVSNSGSGGSGPTTSNPAAAHSSRVNRANNRRFAADITAQLGSETEVLSLNTLTKRKKLVSFARSAIHNWGLYALEPIMAKEMIIEYVGESIRQQVAEHREKSYLKTGIGSSYLFRIDENTVIDATKKGGIARFINHCCDPSCTAKIIKVGNTKRIVIYALRDIDANEELTYDYKFERETNDEERIKCLCGAANCKGYLN